MASTGEVFGLFWNSQDGDRTYDASSFEFWLKKFFTSGVFEGDMQVTAKSGMTIEVGTGYANVDGKVKFWNAATELTLSPANSTYPRIDTVVITRDNVNRQITCEVVTGQYSGDSPVAPAPERDAETYQLVLAQIYVGNGVTEITQADITDTRPDTDLCGYITGTVQEMDFSQFAAQFEGYYENFVNTSEAAFDEWFEDVMESLHNLPADSAEYLQTEIDEIKGKTFTQTLTAGSTTLVFNDALIFTTSTFDIYADVYGLAPTDVAVTTGQAVLTFDPQPNNVSIKLIVT